jgi:uncharacterized membrane protein
MMKALIRNTARDAALYFLLCLAVFLMLRMIMEYYPLDDHSGFLQFKQDHIENKIWKTCFYIHVFSSLFVLMAGLTQFSGYILEHHRWLHRILGRLYAVNILAVNFPCALVMAVYANGELPGKAAFAILDILWFVFTLKAVMEARKGNIRLHKQHMIRSYALTLSAISLRTWKIILVNTTVLDLHTIYIMDAWLGFLPNLLLAEIMIRRKLV